MTNVLMRALVCLALAEIVPGAAVGAGTDTCVPLPKHTPKAARHGHNHWSDEKLRVLGPNPSGVEIPPGWIPVGADKIQANCAFFPPKQAVLFVNPAFWQVETIHSAETGLDLQLLSLKTISPQALETWRKMVTQTYRDVATLFPLGLRADQKLPHVILVTSGIAGDGTRLTSRLFPAPGPNLTNLFHNPGAGRGKDLFIHTTTHLFNKRRPRPEVLPVEDGLRKTEYREMVATWAEIALNRDDGYVRRRVAFLMRQHVLLTDGNPDTWPAAPEISEIAAAKGPFGLPPKSPKHSEAAREYAHYYLGPLIMLAIDGLMVERGTAMSVRTTLQEIHAGNSPGLIAALRHLLPQQMQQIQGWMDGTEQIPGDLVEKGLARLQSRGAGVAQ